MAALLRTEQIPRAANFQIAHRDGEARPQFGKFFDRSQPLRRVGGDVFDRIDHQVTVSPMLVAADSPTQLVQIRQPVAIRFVDENCIRVRDVQAAFHDRRRQQQVKLVSDEAGHHVFQFVLRHLSVADANARLRHDVSQLLGEHRDVFHAIVDEKNLSAAIQFLQHGVANQFVIEPRDFRFHGDAIGRRRFQIRNIAHANQRHVQRARNRRRGHRQHVHRRPQRFQFLLHFDAEPLLFVDDDQPEVVKFDVARRQPVRADHDIDSSGLQPGEDVALFLRFAKAAQPSDVERKLGHPFLERVVMLFGQDRRRHQHRDLITVVHRFEDGSHRHFRFAEPHVAAQQPIHRPRAFHIFLNRFQRQQLVRRFFVRERSIERLLPIAVRAEGDAGPRLPRG